MPQQSKRSDYYNQVYEIVRAIPSGRVMTYGSIASLIPTPPDIDPMAYTKVRARWVGYGMAACPDDVPWHRVINAQGQVSKRMGHGPHVQRVLLEEEGVVFNQKGRIDLKIYRWEPPTDWLLSRGLVPPLAENDTSKSTQPNLFQSNK
jgi:methylated-DNA-protein-cysteine methyltransferase-like protein